MKRPLGIALAAATALAAALAAQDQLPQPTFRAEANYVRVDVFPTRDGMPVADLTAADFEILEDRVPQKIEQFERVVIRAAGGGEGRREPNTVAESREAIKDPRARVFVLFLDPAHVEQATSRQISQTLVNTLNKLIGPDDYVGIMLPPMKLRDVTFARRTTAIENLLRNDWWGQRDSTFPRDPDEEAYASCYPGIPSSPGGTAQDQGIAQQMILRHREMQTFDALEDLVLSVRTLREERKAVLAITDGWLIYRPDQNLLRPLDNSTPPGNPPIGVDPRNGRLSTSAPNQSFDATRRKCELDRQTLANIDDETRMRAIIDEANRSNTAFYPVDPRGLVVFDEGIVPSAGVGAGAAANPTLTPQQETTRLRAREQGLRQLAEGTDGMAIVGTNKIAEALNRVIDDLSSYYLLGYYSTGKLDGKFHAISVRVKRSGVAVRARRGYQALRERDLVVTGATSPAAPARTAGEVALAAAASSAVAKIVNAARDLPLRVSATAGWRLGADGKPAPTFWTVGEVVDRIPGADLDAVLLDGAGNVVSSVKARIAPGTTSTLVVVTPDAPVAAGEYTIRVKSQTPMGAETVSMPVVLPSSPQASGVVFIRRGPTTGNKEMPTADVRFRRSDRVRVEVPSTVDVTSARLLDRSGKPMPIIPVTTSTKTDGDGTKWATAEVLLAPLAPGDYIVEVVAGETRTLAAFRIVL
ncbi:MAG TPA: VWA domain-containing protein [Vicinamibacterales bacterium]|nr:VWA domain-containing protein [Vicinamibacterales bacterium]